MYGSVFKIQMKPGSYAAVRELLDRETRDRPPMAGFVRAYELRESDDVMWVTVVFESEDLYRKNAADPEQDKWYRELRAHLVADPEWHDGEITEEL